MASSAKRKYLIPLCLLLAALLVLCCLSLVRRLFPAKREAQAPAPVTGALDVCVIDVGQGEAVLLKYPEGKTVLLDCGPEAVARQLTDTLAKLGVKRIDTLLLSHSHTDHTGGLSYLLKKVRVGEVLLAGHPSYYTAIEGVLGRRGVKYGYVTAGGALPSSASVTAELFNPPENTGAEEENDLSAVIRFTCGNTSLLFAGDAGYEAESRLLALYARTRLKSDVLLVGHHGASSSSSLSFLKAVSPKIACISVGMGNDYGHPHETTLQRLALVGAEVHTTAAEGTLHLRLDGNSVSVIK